MKSEASYYIVGLKLKLQFHPTTGAPSLMEQELAFWLQYLSLEFKKFMCKQAGLMPWVNQDCNVLQTQPPPLPPSLGTSPLHSMQEGLVPSKRLDLYNALATTYHDIHFCILRTWTAPYNFHPMRYQWLASYWQ